MAGYLQVTTTTETAEEAERIGRILVERRLAACAQVLGPIRSTYWWKGQIETAQEWLCIMKATRERYAALEAAIKELHPYETPEIVGTPIEAGSAEYLQWIGVETARRGVCAGKGVSDETHHETPGQEGRPASGQPGSHR